ncbi:MAG: outer membrane beta-barrel protein [Ignavibacteriaceae bacterium]
MGGTVDVSFSRILGILVDLTAFDMSNFSNTTTIQNQTTENSYSLYYLTLDPMFKTEFSGFYMVAGPSIGIKLSSSGQQTITVIGGGTPRVSTLTANFNSVRFGIELGTGYNFKLSEGLYLATDFMASIPLSNAIDAPGLSNSIFDLKLGTALKFTL